jgi:nicotinamide-nucleotide amidase
MSEEASIDTLARTLVAALAGNGRTVATAESCTGGWIAKALTDVSGSSAVFGYGIVSYSNEAKQALLGVDPEALETHGAVSEAVVMQMAGGALRLSGADLSVAVSGIAGPDGGTKDKPVGTVWFAWAVSTDDGDSIDTLHRRFSGDRASVRSQTVICALEGLRKRLADA